MMAHEVKKKKKGRTKTNELKGLGRRINDERNEHDVEDE